jgi:hypothetical protein
LVGGERREGGCPVVGGLTGLVEQREGLAAGGGLFDGGDERGREVGA